MSLHNKINKAFQMVLESSELRKDGGHFSRFRSISAVLTAIHKELSSSDFHKLKRIHDVILSIWDNHMMCNSGVPSLYNNRYPYESKPTDRSIFESIIRRMIMEQFASIERLIIRLFSSDRDIYRENKEIIESVLKIVLQLPLEEMFEIRQTSPNLPIHLSVLYNVDKFIEVYIWTVLIIFYDMILLEYPIQKVSSDELCAICKDESNTIFLKITDSCIHSFCSSCITKLLKYNNRCPMCRHEYQKIDVVGVCNQAVAVFLDERRKRNEEFSKIESEGQLCLIQFLEKRGFDMTTIYTEHPIRCFSNCGNIYTNGWKGTHKCGPKGELHHATKHVGMASLSVLCATECCLKCQGTFYAYKDCGHILCEAHLDQKKYNCPKCSKYSFFFKLNF